MKKGLFALVAGIAVAALPLEAQAQRFGDEASFQGFSAFGIFGYYYAGSGLGAGLRYALPIAEGVLDESEIDDQFALEFGADMVFWGIDVEGSGASVVPVVGLVWNFWLADGAVGLYPKFDLGYEFEVASEDFAETFNRVWWDIGFGVVWRASEDWALRAEASRGLLRLGVGFGF